jgi:hypothetical protein
VVDLDDTHGSMETLPFSLRSSATCIRQLSFDSPCQNGNIRDTEGRLERHSLNLVNALKLALVLMRAVARKLPSVPPRVIGMSSYFSSVALSWKRVVALNRTLLWLLVAVALTIGFLLYRSRSSRNLNADPHSRELIEKAKRR